MPYPTEGETKEQYVKKFMSSEEACKDFTDEKQRYAVAMSLWSRRGRKNSSYGNYGEEAPWPKMYQCKYIESGVVAYQDLGPCEICGDKFSCGNDGGECKPKGETILVQSPALEKMGKTLVGRPILNLEHGDVTSSTVADGEAEGVVTREWLDPKSGWRMAEFVVWDPDTQKNCESGDFFVSCAYEPSDVSNSGGDWHNVPFASEILDGNMTHMAIVRNPRYGGAEISRVLVNSKGGRMNWKWFGSDSKNATALDPIKTTVDVDGKKVSLQELFNSVKAPSLNDTTVVEVDGTKHTIAELKNAYRESLKNNACPSCKGSGIRNAGDEDSSGDDDKDEKHDKPEKDSKTESYSKEEKHEEEFPKKGEFTSKEKDNALAGEAAKGQESDKAEADAKKNAGEAAKDQEPDKAEAEAKKNADDSAKEDEKKEAEERKNAVAEARREAGRKAFAELRHSRQEFTGGTPVAIEDREDRLARGREKYGSR